jgi:hypothetical protein
MSACCTSMHHSTASTVLPKAMQNEPSPLILSLFVFVCARVRERVSAIDG